VEEEEEEEEAERVRDAAAAADQRARDERPMVMLSTAPK
jgi:hypothetical protein